MPHTKYDVISANSVPEFQTSLIKATVGGWKPILLTSAPVGEFLKIVAIMEHTVGLQPGKPKR
ncbi:MAG: hypothetical protein ACLQJF_21090 [Candidatus Sulfotelmatobacter sp.]|jgi:hypothetical protein